MAAFESLFENSIDDEEEEKLHVNKAFAKKYQKFKECQELDKLKAKYGDVALDEHSDSSSEEEDDNAEALTPQLEEDFMKTLSMIKSKDPKIYNQQSEFYRKKGSESEDADEVKSKKKKEKTVYLKDYERQRLLEKGSKAYLSDSDSENEAGTFFKQTKDPSELTYNEEQEQIKNSFKMADSHSDEDDDALLHLREKSSKEEAEEEKEYRSWLKKEGTSLDALGNYWKKNDLDENEQFLRDYILNRQFMGDQSEGVPSYNDVVSGFDTDDDEQEEEELNREEEFERKFNFRYEEPDQEFIKKYPRTIAESVRRVDDSRKVKRKDRDERKDKEKEKKKEELKRLKNLKRKEIMEKIEKLKAITGNDKVGFLEDDMDGDFDASKYDEIMQSVFDDDYYDVDDEEDKPEFSDVDEDNDGFMAEEDWDQWTGPDAEQYDDKNYEPHCEDDDFNMDADFIDTRKSKQKKQVKVFGKQKRRSKFAEALNRRKPVFDPNEKSFEEYFDEYYKLDFEDIIGDMPVRFKYRTVLPNTYGLSTEEILEADDKELNEWCALKRTIRYNTDAEERMERQKYKKKGRNKKKKLQVFNSLNADKDKRAEDDSSDMMVDTDEPGPSTSSSKQDQKKQNITAQRKNNKNNSQLRNIDAKSQRGFKKTSQLHSKFSENTNRHAKLRSNPNAKSQMSNTKQRKLLNRFKGADAKTMDSISSTRLAAYGLDKRKAKE